MPLRDHQATAVQSIFDYFSVNKGNPIVVLPTGTGKSHVIAGFIEWTLKQWTHPRFIVATHVKELIEQNAEKLRLAWPACPIGIHSAGLGRRDTQSQVIVGGIQSMINHVAELSHRDILIIDECHLLSPNGESRYQRFIEALRVINPFMKVIGLSATPYRLGQGHLCDDGLFTDVCCHQADIRWFDYFIAAGYLTPVVPKKPEFEIDVSRVRMQRGDFAIKQLQETVDVDEITQGAVDSMIAHGQDRRSWLVFASGVAHAQNVAQYLTASGVPAEAIYGALPKADRDALIDRFRQGELKCLVNNNVLTTGFDHPPIDFIGMLRPTTSPGLWVQMVGRGMRPSPDTGKENCLVLDFAGNTARLGPVNDPVLPRKRGKGGDGAPPVKLCPACDCYNHPTAKACYFCGFVFPITPKISTTASGLELLASGENTVEVIDVTKVTYRKHTKKDKPPSLRVTYHNGVRRFEEWVCLEHDAYSRNIAERWWLRRMRGPGCPPTVDDALRVTKYLAVPRQLRVWMEGKYPKILDHIF